MESQVTIYLLIFIIAICVLCIGKNLQQGMVLAVIVTNIFVVYSHLNKNMGRKKKSGEAPPPTPAPTTTLTDGQLRDLTGDTPAPTPFSDSMPRYGEPEREVDEGPTLYNPENYQAYSQFKGGHADTAQRVRTGLEARQQTTNANDRIADYNLGSGGHAKMTQVGGATKTSDYYKYHFGDEFSTEEKKEWWGQTDMPLGVNGPDLTVEPYDR